LIAVVLPDIAAETPSKASYIVRQLIACAIWIPYFVRSERVKRTFVVRRARSAPHPAFCRPQLGRSRNLKRDARACNITGLL